MSDYLKLGIEPGWQEYSSMWIRHNQKA